MSIKGKTRICLFLIFCAAGLTEAFNSRRREPDEAPSTLTGHHSHSEHLKETKDSIVVPENPIEETAHKVNSRVRRGRQRHERNRRDKSTEEAMMEVFKRPSDPNAIPNTGYDTNGYAATAFTSSGYNYMQPQQQFFLPQQQFALQQPYYQPQLGFSGPSYLPAAGPSHNTLVPNGNQVNNYYSQLPTYTVASNPWAGLPENFPKPFYYGPFLIIPIPICLPNNNNNNNNNQPDPNSIDDTPLPAGGLNNRFNDPEPFDLSKYYGTETGIDLRPVPPSRTPSATPPPADRSQQGNPNSNSQQGFPQASRPQQIPPQVQQRPQQLPPQQLRPQQPSLQQPRPQQLAPPQQRPQPIPVRPPPQASRPFRPQSPPRPIVRPVEDLDDPPISRGGSCVWAIVTCCNHPRPVSVPECFQRQGCPGAYFDNPCDSQLAKNISNAANEITANGLLFS